MLLRFALAALLLATPLAHAEHVSLGGLSVEWLDGAKVFPLESPVRIRDANGATTLITAHCYAPSDAATERFADNQRFAEAQLPQLAAGQGTVTASLKREELSDGTVLYSTATRTSRLFKSGFYLQFMVLPKSSSIALFTIEGKGDVNRAYSEYRPLFDTVRWEP